MGKDLYISKKKILVFNLFFLLCILILLTKLPFQDQTTPVLNSSVNSTVSENYIDIYCKTYSSEIPALKLYIDNNNAYFFLPACTALDDLSFQFDEEKYLISLNDIPIHSQDSLTAYSLNTEYHMCVTNIHDTSGASTNYNLIFMQSCNLPAVFITTESGSIDLINESKDNSESGTFTCITDNGSVDSYGFLSKIIGHGNSSFDETNKKSYQITFYNATDVLFMGAATKYILQANAFDPAYMRNKLTYEFCSDLGISYTVDSEYVDLYINGEYTGNYLLCEKVELGSNRINIPNGYLIEKMWSARITDSDAVLKVDETEYFIVKEPAGIPQNEIEYLSDYMNMIENRISSCSSYSQYQQLSEYIDLDSFIDMYLVNVITNDIDCNIASTYYYKTSNESGGQLYAGPVWDYDKAFGNDRRGRNIALNAYPSGYCEELFEIEYFRDAMVEKFNQTAYPLSLYYSSDYIDETDSYIHSSCMMDNCRWNNKLIESTDDNYENEVLELKNYMHSRLEFVNDYLNHPEKYHDVVFINMSEQPLYRDSKYWIIDGDVIPDKIISAIKERFHIDAIVDENGHPYNNTPIYSDTIFYGQ